jgi:hypothetical protein
MKRAACLALLLLLPACVDFHPVPIRTDPNEEAQARMEEQNAQAQMNAFIAAHPEFDAETRRQLRAGEISRQDAIEKSRKR